MPQRRFQNSFPAKDYWKLVDPKSVSEGDMKFYLRSKNVTPRNSDNRVSLEHAFLRAQNGRPDYRFYDSAELETICQARGLPHEESRSTNAKTLNQADKRQTFDQFMELPPELRLKVYKYHFADICERTSEREPIPGSCRGDEIGGMLLPEPPLTKACRMIRAESLPTWYDDTTFNVAIGLQWDIPDPATGVQLVPHFQFNETERFLRTASREAMQRIRRLHIVGKLDVSGGGEFRLACDYYIYLQPKGNIVTSVRARWESSPAASARSGNVATEKDVREAMTRRLNIFVEENASTKDGFTARTLDPFGKLFKAIGSD
ncbi:hypothetical protein CKM354_000090800 [Cercospora kikuchii]|uniref:Uncharacterized protein n=1 Tax=Cercospora kikuchii TaxID=84275 RepID=A0A9P3C6Y7_9PEZI|nr:uncharacterized protein CKM354_000090800 [Cercospora kikuchii]GIZ37463.1 hypothetical protein CKM354_000090800 [Cercospora kikuchii]